jgi:hypothetical protein
MFVLRLFYGDEQRGVAPYGAQSQSHQEYQKNGGREKTALRLATKHFVQDNHQVTNYYGAGTL